MRCYENSSFSYIHPYYPRSISNTNTFGWTLFRIPILVQSPLSLSFPSSSSPIIITPYGVQCFPNRNTILVMSKRTPSSNVRRNSHTPGLTDSSPVSDYHPSPSTPAPSNESNREIYARNDTNARFGRPLFPDLNSPSRTRQPSYPSPTLVPVESTLTHQHGDDSNLHLGSALSAATDSPATAAQTRPAIILGLGISYPLSAATVRTSASSPSASVIASYPAEGSCGVLRPWESSVFFFQFKFSSSSLLLLCFSFDRPAVKSVCG